MAAINVTDAAPVDIATGDDAGGRYVAVVGVMGPGAVYVDFDTDADSGEALQFQPGDTFLRDLTKHQRISAICAPGETCQVRVIRDAE